MQLAVVARGASAVEELRQCIDGESRVAHRLAHDSGVRGSVEVRPQRLAAAATQIVRVIPRKEQHPSAKPILRKHAQGPPVEIHAERYRPQDRRN
jgi:hypothetical protein